MTAKRIILQTKLLNLLTYLLETEAVQVGHDQWFELQMYFFEFEFRLTIVKNFRPKPWFRLGVEVACSCLNSAHWRTWHFGV